jgi:hypothetical protein
MINFFAALHDNRDYVNAFCLEIFEFNDETNLITAYHGSMPVLNKYAQEALERALSRIVSSISGDLAAFDAIKQDNKSDYANFDNLDDLKCFFNIK